MMSNDLSNDLSNPLRNHAQQLPLDRLAAGTRPPGRPVARYQRPGAGIWPLPPPPRRPPPSPPGRQKQPPPGPPRRPPPQGHRPPSPWCRSPPPGRRRPLRREGGREVGALLRLGGRRSNDGGRSVVEGAPGRLRWEIWELRLR